MDIFSTHSTLKSSPPEVFLRKRSSEIRQPIYKRTPMLHIFRRPFYKKTYGELFFTQYQSVEDHMEEMIEVISKTNTSIPKVTFHNWEKVLKNGPSQFTVSHTNTSVFNI